VEEEGREDERYTQIKRRIGDARSTMSFGDEAATIDKSISVAQSPQQTVVIL
jgi:hypothetical protein